MKKLKQKLPWAQLAAPSLANEIALEFVRISKLSEAGKKDEAWQAANALHNKYPNEATPNFVMALMLADKEEKQQALPFAKAAVNLAPGNAMHKVFLGKLYVDLRLVEFATALLHQAFAIDKTQFQAPLTLAYYYSESGQGSRAMPYFDLALHAAPPAHKPMISWHRANCLVSVGRAKEAEADYLKLMEGSRYRIPALKSLAVLKRCDINSDYAGQIRKELDQPGLNDEVRSPLLLCLGRLYENSGDFDNAFLHYDRSRELLRSKPYVNRLTAILDDVSRVLTRDIFEKSRNYGHESDRPIFVVGMPRSGTTMTEQIIAAHSQAEGVGELMRIPAMAQNFSGSGGMRQVLNTMTAAGPERWKDAPRQYLNLLDTLAPGARRAVDKMPHNFQWLGFIRLCFPNVKIIHCKRHPLDCFVSAFQNEMTTGHDYSYEQVRYGEYYVSYLRLMELWKNMMPENIYESRYEEMTTNPEIEVRKMLDFLGLPWEEACLNFHERSSTVKTFSRMQVRNPINTGSIARWRKYEKHLAPLIEVLEQAGVHI